VIEPRAGRLSRRSALIAATSALIAAAFAPNLAVAHKAEPVHIGDAPPGRAQIVFYRKWTYPASLDTYAVREGHTKLGNLDAGSYFIAIVDPGLHTYGTRALRSDNMQIVVEAGETYYVRFELESGIFLYQPTLTPSEQRLFDQTSAKLRLSGSTPQPEPPASP
jgi:hypothetical protein